MKWGKEFIIQCWNIPYQLWHHRNNILHQHSTDLLHGLPILKVAIESEYEKGTQDLPTTYNRYFCTPLPILLNKSTTYLKRWFLVIRSGRESIQPIPIRDIWYNNQALRKWIGLPPTSTN